MVSVQSTLNSRGVGHDTCVTYLYARKILKYSRERIVKVEDGVLGIIIYLYLYLYF